jgi:ATP-dependent Clp protease ATP-binding subunit ClpB
MAERMAKRDLQLEFSEALVEFVAKAGFDPQFGARPLKRVIQREIEDTLAKALLAGDINSSEAIRIDYSDHVLIMN